MIHVAESVSRIEISSFFFFFFFAAFEFKPSAAASSPADATEAGRRGNSSAVICPSALPD